MLIAEDLLLLLTDDSTGKLVTGGPQVDFALAGAMLVELTLMQRVDLAGEDEQVRAGRLVVRDPAPIDDPLLDGALQRVGTAVGKKPASVLTPLGKGVRAALYARLVARGILRAEQGRILGILPTHAWPSQDVQHENAVRHAITNTLVQGVDRDSRTAALVSLLHALRCEHKVVDPKRHGLSRKELGARAKRVAEGDWGSQAVRQAIDSMMAAVSAATTAAAVSATISSGS